MAIPQFALDLGVETVDDPAAGVGNQSHLTGLSRLETHGRARRNVEAKPAGFFAIEPECFVGFEKMIVGAHLDWSVTNVFNAQGDGFAAVVQSDIAGGWEQFSGDQDGPLSADWVVYGHKFGAIRKGGLHLDLVKHFSYALHHLIVAEDRRALLHQIGDTVPVAGTLRDEIADQRDGLRIVELDTAFQAAARYHCRHGDEQFVLLSRC